MILGVLITIGFVAWLASVLKAAPAEQARADVNERLKSICGN
ncbi:MAG TPA: hypothetical protein VJ793_11370 [Anaerolineae bacterium]|nr:hypothetical protein [Anaerolineae bacterium]